MKRKNSTIPSARQAALTTIGRVLRGADLQAALDDVLRETRLKPRDSRLATELSYGYMRLKGRIDHLVQSHLKKPGSLPPKLEQAIGIATLELIALDRTPSYATLDWAVEYAKTEFNPALAKFVNAVLRNIDRLGADANNIDFYSQNKAARETVLSRFYSCPEWIVRLWLANFGEKAALAYLQAQCSPAPVGLRVNRLHGEYAHRLKRLKGNKSLLFHEGNAFALPAGGLPELDEWLADHSVFRQSAASQQAIMSLSPDNWPKPVWDACCGRGGKTMLLHELGISALRASDVHLKRLRGLKKQCAELGRDIPVFRAKADAPAPFSMPVGTVLCDVPCSGLGVLSRRPDSKWKRRPEDLANLAEIQKRIVERAFRTILPGGCVAYVTCTLNPDENENIVNGFCAQHPRAEIVRTFQTPADSPLNEFFYAALIRSV